MEFTCVLEYIDFHARMRGMDLDTAKRAFKDDHDTATPDMKGTKGPKYAPERVAVKTKDYMQLHKLWLVKREG